MDTFAYLHTACAYEELEAAELTLNLDRLNLKLLSSQAGLLLLQLLVPAAILAVTGHASALQVGDRGVTVTTLQDQLRSAGYFNRSSTGFYKSITESAVRQFQSDRGLRVDGIAGPETQRALRGQAYATSGTIQPISSTTNSDRGYRPIAYTSELLKLGSSGPDVRDLQQQLKQRGYSVEADGIYGSETERAVRQFQADNGGLGVDGQVGSATRSALGLSSPSNPGGNGSSASLRKRYVVVVPVKSTTTLSQVQRFFPRAFVASSNLGKYVRAEAFDIRGLAEAEATRLRAYKLDAQVRYF